MATRIEKKQIFKGDTTPIATTRVTGEGSTLAGWVCDHKLVDSSGVKRLEKTNLTPFTATKFSCFFEPIDTDTLVAGTYNWVIIVRNDSLTPKIKQTSYLLLEVKPRIEAV